MSLLWTWNKLREDGGDAEENNRGDETEGSRMEEGRLNRRKSGQD